MPNVAEPRSSKARSVALLLALGTLVAAALGGYNYYQNRELDRLYAEAAGLPPYYRSSRQSAEAVRKLATYDGERATRMLLAVALSPSPLLGGDAQHEAIRALAKRGDPKVAGALADLLQPHEGLDNRRAVADALQSLPCDAPCARSVLHYLERVWKGEPNVEDLATRLPGYEEVAAALQADQRLLYDRLYTVLRRESAQTLSALVDIYGLGTNCPSPFGVDLAARLDLREACPLLLQSHRQIEAEPPESFKRRPRGELRAALAKLKCK